MSYATYVYTYFHFVSIRGISFFQSNDKVKDMHAAVWYTRRWATRSVRTLSPPSSKMSAAQSSETPTSSSAPLRECVFLLLGLICSLIYSTLQTVHICSVHCFILVHHTFTRRRRFPHILFELRQCSSISTPAPQKRRLCPVWKGMLTPGLLT